MLGTQTLALMGSILLAIGCSTSNGSDNSSDAGNSAQLADQTASCAQVGPAVCSFAARCKLLTGDAGATITQQQCDQATTRLSQSCVKDWNPNATQSDVNECISEMQTVSCSEVCGHDDSAIAACDRVLHSSTPSGECELESLRAVEERATDEDLNG